MSSFPALCSNGLVFLKVFNNGHCSARWMFPQDYSIVDTYIHDSSAMQRGKRVLGKPWETCQGHGRSLSVLPLPIASSKFCPYVHGYLNINHIWYWDATPLLLNQAQYIKRRFFLCLSSSLWDFIDCLFLYVTALIWTPLKPRETHRCGKFCVRATASK